MNPLPQLLAAALFVGFCASPARAYRVFLDHDQDGDLSTFDNIVEGALSAPITITVVLGTEDATREDVGFTVSWDCHHVDFWGVPHGDITWELPIPPQPPFTDPHMDACTGFGCACVAERVFSSPLGTPRTPGSYRFAVLGFSRFADYNCVQFAVSCSDCSYLPGDEAKTVMSFTTLIGVEPESWGRTKAAYR